MKAALVIALALFSACVDSDQAIEPCADLGCIELPSGSPTQWEQCTDAVCYCKVAHDEVLACSVGGVS